MLSLIISVLVISSIAAVLALVLVISERFITNYGQCNIDINCEKQLTVRGGNSLLNELTQEKIFIPSACGGKGTCGLCKIKVTEGARQILPTETPFLTEEEKTSSIRLSCQIKVRNDLVIEIPKELLAIKEYACRCTDILDLTHDIKMFSFECVEPQAIDFIPGRYVQLLAPAYAKGLEEVYRAYSVASDRQNKNMIELIIRLVPGGICTTYCFDYLKVGDDVLLNGPYGDFCLSDSDAPIVFIAGGTGIAPIRSILHYMAETNCQRKATFYFGANKVKELFLLDEMKQFEKQLPNFKFVPVVASPDEDEKWDGQLGLVTQAVQQNLKNASEHEAYLCGSPGMIDASIEVLKKMGIPEDNIFFDKFA